MIVRYSLPTGASSLALITQYFPTAYIQIAYLSAVLLYCLYASNQSKDPFDNCRITAPLKSHQQKFFSTNRNL